MRILAQGGGILAISLVLLEIVLRFLNLPSFHGGEAQTGNQITQFDAILHHKLIPGLSKVITAREEPYTAFANSQSWVEAYEVEQQKPEGTFRVFYVGDSNTEGVVPSGSKMVDLVEAELNARSPGPRIEVINTGTSSYSTLLYLILLKTKILSFEPDLVVLNMDMNDVPNDSLYKNFLIKGSDGEILGASHPELNSRASRFQYYLTPNGFVSLEQMPPWYRILRSYSKIVEVVDRIHIKMSFERAMGGRVDNRAKLKVSADWLDLQWTPEIEGAVNYSMGILNQIIALLRERGVPLLVTSVPYYHQFTGKASARPHAVLEETLRSAGVPFLNSHAALKESIEGTSQTTYYWKNDPTHLNRAGNLLWSKEHLRVLRQHDLVPQRGM